MRPELTDYCCTVWPGLTFLLACLPVCLLAFSPSYYLTFPYPPASQPANPLHSAAVSACAALPGLARLSLSRPANLTRHPRTRPTLARILPCSQAARSHNADAVQLLAGSCLALKYRQPRLCLTGQSALPCLVLLHYSNNTVTPACRCARTSPLTTFTCLSCSRRYTSLSLKPASPTPPSPP